MTAPRNKQWGRDGDEDELRDRHTRATDPEHMSWWVDRRRPATTIEAIMQAAPGDEPAESSIELQDRLGPVRDALEDPELLTDKERFVIEQMFFARQSTRDLSAVLPWSTTQIHRIKHSAMEKLRERLEGHYELD